MDAINRGEITLMDLIVLNSMIQAEDTEKENMRRRAERQAGKK